MVGQTKTAEPTIVNGINVDDLFALTRTSGGTQQGQTVGASNLQPYAGRRLEIGGDRVTRRF
jgi:hypothetical protein